jgi:subtilisin family serine protease
MKLPIPRNIPKLKPTKKITNPYTSTYFFGCIPEIAHCGIDEGLIILKYGVHFGYNRGYGAAHIWAGHAADIRKLGYMQENPLDAIAQYIADIIKPNTPIYWDSADLDGTYRLTVLSTAKGRVVLMSGEDETGGRIHSVITAYPKKTAMGTLVGITKKVP